MTTDSPQNFHNSFRAIFRFYLGQSRIDEVEGCFFKVSSNVTGGRGRLPSRKGERSKELLKTY